MTNLDRVKLANQIAQDTCGKSAVETSLAIATAAQNQTPALSDQEFNALTQTVNQFRGIYSAAVNADKQLAARAPRPAATAAPATASGA